MYTAIAICKQ